MSSPHARLALMLVVATASAARGACDPSGVDAAAIVPARTAIDGACPCAAAASRSAYRACARGVLSSTAVRATLVTP